MTVYLVGAGPGDPGLLTVRGRDLLQIADVVMYDALAESSLLALAPKTAELIDVGKRPGGPIHQDEINAQLIAFGRAGKNVVRLKGGDPFVFGRGGEEAEALIAAGVPFEVVPGVSSAIAVPAYAGVPVTHRGLSTSFTVVTGHSRHAVDIETNWDALAQAGGTIVVLMGVAHRAEVASRLMQGGLSPETPVVATRAGTRPDQHTIRTTLGRLGETPMQPSVTMVIGAVAGLDLAWFAPGPLAGKRVVVTRAEAQAGPLTRALHALGAQTIDLPVIEVVDALDGGAALRAVLANLTSYDWAVFTSTNAVERAFAEVRDARAWGATKVAAVGTATATALERRGIVVDIVPERFVAEAVVDAMPDGPGRVLFPRADGARDVIIDGLRAKGWDVDAVDAYRTVPVAPPHPERARDADAVIFTSSSTVSAYLACGAPVPPVVAVLGPITARTAEAAGIHVDVVAEASTIGSLVDALTRRLEA